MSVNNTSKTKKVSSTKKENIHKDHRERVRQRFLKYGFDTFDEHVIMEALLFYSIPVKDTNPLAHKLINHFGGIVGVLDASYEELLTVEGVGEKTAIYLTMLGDLVKTYFQKKTSEKKEVKSNFEYGEIVFNHLLSYKDECILLILIKNNIIVNLKILEIGNSSSVIFDSNSIVRLIVQSESDSIVIAHNHPNGSLDASVNDIRSMNAIHSVLANINLQIINYYIVTNNGYRSILDEYEKNRTLF